MRHTHAHGHARVYGCADHFAPRPLTSPIPHDTQSHISDPRQADMRLRSHVRALRDRGRTGGLLDGRGAARAGLSLPHGPFRRRCVRVYGRADRFCGSLCRRCADRSLTLLLLPRCCPFPAAAPSPLLPLPRAAHSATQIQSPIHHGSLGSRTFLHEYTPESLRYSARLHVACACKRFRGSSISANAGVRSRNDFAVCSPTCRMRPAAIRN